MSLVDGFRAYCASQGVNLSRSQQVAAKVLLDAIEDWGDRDFFGLRGTGASFLLDEIEEFLRFPFFYEESV